MFVDILKASLLSGLFLTGTCQAVLLHNSVDDQASQQLAMKYPAVCHIMKSVTTDKGKTFNLAGGTGTLCTVGNSKHIITARHVLLAENDNDFEAIGWKVSIKATFDNGETLSFTKDSMLMHKEDHVLFQNYDVALLKVGQDQEITVEPIKIALDSAQENEKAITRTVVGFGLFGRYNDSGRGRFITESEHTKRAGSLKVSFKNDITKKFGPANSSKFLPAYEKDYDAGLINGQDVSIAYGDSGGPLLNEQGEICGVVANFCRPLINFTSSPALYRSMPDDSWFKKSLISMDSYLSNTAPTLQRWTRAIAHYWWTLPDFSVRTNQSFHAVDDAQLKVWLLKPLSSK